MADAVTSQTLVDGRRNAVIKLTNVSDGTGESAVLKVDVSGLSGSPAAVRIDRIEFTTRTMGVNLLWDATTPVQIINLPPNFSEELDFCKSGGLVNTKATGWTGDIKLTTVGHASGAAYTIVLHLVKKY